MKPIHFLCAIAASGTLLAQTRYHDFTKQFGNPTDGATVLSAGFFGGAGHEWLAAGGFTANGAIVLAGNVIGPEFRQATVLGQDDVKPPEAIRLPDADHKGVQRTNKDGSLKWKSPKWTDAGVTGFILLATADMKTITSAQRLPWQSGAITACVVGNDGSIYIAGKASEGITRVATNVKELTSSENGMKSGACDHTFVAKISGDRIEWARHLKGPSNAPKLEILNDGSLQFTAQDLRNLSTTGEELGKLVIPGGPGHLTAVNPKDGTWLRGGEHHSPTGREPYRCPILRVYQPNGDLLHHLYDWTGPYVGLDNLRLVSDTAIRRVTYDPQGNICLYLWSDGGNSVALREPFDIQSYAARFQGLGFTSWGAGVLSVGYLIKLNPLTYQVSGGTMWCSFLESANKPNSAWIDQLAFAPDGSACFTGRAANSVVQTHNRVSQSQGGQHVVVLRDDLKSIRFSSTVPGTGRAITGNADESWGIASVPAGGKQRVLFLTGADAGDGDFKTPVVNSSQNTFGGGWMDGYAMLLEMDKNPPSQPAVTPVDENTGWTTRGTAKKASSLVDAKGRGPETGQTFRFEKMKWVTVDAEFRDPSGTLWPSFFFGHPSAGLFTYDTDQPEMQCTLTCDRACLPGGNQSTRVLGEWVPEDGKVKDFSLEIQAISPLQIRQETRKENKKEKKREVTFATADVVMKAHGKTYPVKAECQFAFRYAGGSKVPEGVQMDARFTTTGKALGLKNPKTGEIQVRFSAVANSTKVTDKP